MNEQAFRALIELVQFDQATHAIKVTIDTVNQELNALRTEEQKIHHELETAKRAFADARKLVDEKELEAKELDEQESRAKKRLDTAQSHREYEALKSEVTQLQATQHNLETEIINAWDKADAAEKVAKEMQQKSDVAVADINNAIALALTRIEALKSELAGRAPEHDRKAAQVPAEWIEKYRSMGSHVTDPVVPILGDACSGCFYQLITQDLLRLKRGALLQCKGCFRFLYDPQVMEQIP